MERSKKGHKCWGGSRKKSKIDYFWHIQGKWLVNRNGNMKCQIDCRNLSRDTTKPTKWLRPAKTQISLSIRPVWSESSLSAWRELGSLVTHWGHSEDSDQTWCMPRLIWVVAGRTLILLVLSCRGSFILHLSIPWPSKIPNRPLKIKEGASDGPDCGHERFHSRQLLLPGFSLGLLF